MNTSTTTANVIVAVLLNNSMILGFEHAEPPPDLDPLREALIAGSARLRAGPDLLEVVFEEQFRAGQFQISLNSNLVCELMVGHRASNINAWDYFLDRFNQRAASGAVFQAAPITIMPSWEPWLATFMWPAALRLTPEAYALLRGTMLAVARWYLE